MHNVSSHQVNEDKKKNYDIRSAIVLKYGFVRKANVQFSKNTSLLFVIRFITSNSQSEAVWARSMEGVVGLKKTMLTPRP